MTKIFHGIQHLPEVQHAVSICFDTETLQLKPEVGKLRLLQLGAPALETIVVIDLFDLTIPEWGKLEQFFTNGERFWLAHNAVFDLAFQASKGQCPRPGIAAALYNDPNIKHSLCCSKTRLDIDPDSSRPATGVQHLTTNRSTMAKDVEVSWRWTLLQCIRRFKSWVCSMERCPDYFYDEQVGEQFLLHVEDVPLSQKGKIGNFNIRAKAEG